MKGLLGGVILPGAHYTLMRDACTAFNIAPEELIDSGDGDIEFMSSAHNPNDPTRVWWEKTSSNGRKSWISINPGEFRTEPPDPHDLILPLPDRIPSITARIKLEQAVASCAALPPISPHEVMIFDLSKMLLVRNPEEARFKLRGLVQKALESRDQASYQEAVQHIYDAGLSQMSFNAMDFTSGIVMMHLQAIANVRVQQDWSKDPASFMRNFTRLLLDNSTTRKKIIAALYEIAEVEFDTGRQYVAEALDGAMAAVSSKLMFAWHRFLLAHIVIRALKDAGLSEAELPVNSIVSEEAVACTITGIKYRAHFAMNHPDAGALELRAASRPTLEELRRRARSYSSEIVPAYTRRFADILAAQALTFEQDAHAIRAGLAELDRLDPLLNLDAEVELAWLDHVRLNAWIRLGETEKAKGVALRITGQIITRSALGNS